jgi:HTH-type transcriptional regulator/antitoxin HigA
VAADFRKANPDAPLDRQQRAWVARARQLAAAHPVCQFDRARIPDMVAKLRRLAAYPRECLDVCEVLRLYGIRFVVVEPLEKCRIDGAAFWLEDSPAVALSMRYGRMDMFWFTLMHEVAHIIHNDWGSVDTDLAGKDQLPSRLKSQTERRADEAAASMLIPPQEMADFIKLYSPLYSKTRIIQFAHRIKIHPSIIVGQLQHRGELGWDGGRGLLTDVRQYIIDSALTDGWGKSISPGIIE